MFTIEEIMNMFLTETIIESMGNWYARVLAVMSCVIPFSYIVFGFVLSFLLLYGLWKVLTGRV